VHDQFARISAGELVSLSDDTIQAESGEDTRIVYFRQHEEYHAPISVKPSPKWYKFPLSTTPFLVNRFAIANQYSSCSSRWQELGGEGRIQWLNFYHYRAETVAMEFTRPTEEGLTPLKPLEGLW
jgi:hypothetical protein